MLANAFIIIDEVERHGGDLEGMTLGGGTSMMLQINHRNSKDIDFSLSDPQLLGFFGAASSDAEAWTSGFRHSRIWRWTFVREGPVRVPNSR